MNEAQGAAATGESEETTQEPITQAGQVTQPTMLGALLDEMDIPSEVRDLVKPKAESGKPKTESEEEEKPEQEQEQEQEQEEPAEKEAGDTPATTGEEETVPEEWPQSAKARVAEEAEKRRKWKGQAEQWEGTARNLHAQLQQAQAQPKATVGPTPQDPLAGVFSAQDLVQAKKQYRELKYFAEDHPEGAFDVLIGKDAQGNEVRRDYSAEDIRQMRRTAEIVLDEAVPVKETYLKQADTFTREAVQVFPEMFKEGSEMNREAAAVLDALPEIRKSPDYLMWLGDAISHRRERLKKGAARNGKPLSGQAQAILNQPRMAVAPGVTKTRSVESTRGNEGASVDRKSAREELINSDLSDEARERYIGKILSGSGRKGGKAPALV